MRGAHGWAEVSRERKREIIEAIAANRATRGPVHAELDLTDRCNVACYFCNQQDLRTKESIPQPKLTDLIDELADNGLKSVRLSGGGDPLFHRDVLRVMDHLAMRDVVIDNLTTNGVALTADVATRLVRNKAREVIFSLNAVDAADYARMMQVKPALFDKVLENIRALVAVRGDSVHPSIVVQLLIDKKNVHRLVDMYELGRSLGPDRIAISAVLEIPRARIDPAILLATDDRDAAEPLLEEILRRDRDTGLLQIDFPEPDAWPAARKNAVEFCGGDWCVEARGVRAQSRAAAWDAVALLFYYVQAEADYRRKRADEIDRLLARYASACPRTLGQARASCALRTIRGRHGLDFRRVQYDTGYRCSAVLLTDPPYSTDRGECTRGWLRRAKR